MSVYLESTEENLCLYTWQTQRKLMPVHLANVYLRSGKHSRPFMFVHLATQKNVYVCTPGKHWKTFMYVQLANTQEHLCMYTCQTQKVLMHVHLANAEIIHVGHLTKTRRTFMFEHMANSEHPLTFMYVHLAKGRTFMSVHQANIEQPLYLYIWQTQKNFYVCAPGKH